MHLQFKEPFDKMTRITDASNITTTTTAAPVQHHNKLFRLQSSYRFHEWRPWLAFFWACHFMISILILCWGVIHNHDTKYIPINLDALEDFGDATSRSNCSKGFVNVFASSMEDPGALVCCSNDDGSADNYLGTLEDGICNPPHWLFFISRRLARFPEAWLFPLFPLFVRLIVQALRRQRPGAKSSSDHLSSKSNSNTQYRLALRRFYLYVGLIQFRGWILYLLFDKLEEWLVASAGRDCWYEPLLHEDYNACQGQATDFSDHVVLYFAQILPIAFVEVLHSFAEPFWTCRTHLTTNSTGGPSSPFRISKAVPTILIVGTVYLYVVTFMGAYKTAVYFHTWREIMSGYSISLLVQVPLCLMQCTTLLDSTREYFFGYAS